MQTVGKKDKKKEMQNVGTKDKKGNLICRKER
jgi:hypothetical protein